MLATSTIRRLTPEEAFELSDHDGAFVDLRATDAFLDVHIPGSLNLLYEKGPGFASRARDCLPLSLHLVLLDDGSVDPVAAAAALRGKGFDVVGALSDGINVWAQHHTAPASTEVVEVVTEGMTVLDVGDPGASAPHGSIAIPVERLWSRIDEVRNVDRPVVAAGFGVRAALAIGILEHHGVTPGFLKTRR
ncbi:MAG TPA: rhodanese-like domain-containing protein [Actinomycetota bacterium]|nr:rhodanese-like domain-containing protein [Actinomycetota bacterium]